MNPPYHKAEPLEYVDANTGEVRYVEMIRRFYAWDVEKRRYAMVRQYPIKNEVRVNPGMAGIR